MTTTPVTPARPGNTLLARLPADESRRLLPFLHPVQLPFEQTFYEQLGPIEAVYFPTTAVISAVTVMADGSAIEVATVGHEGMVGQTAAAGEALSPNRVLVQVAGDGLRMSAGDLRREAARSGPLRALLARYSDAFLGQVSRSVACNGLHPVQKRCCRWLLMTHDRVGSDALRLTHEYLGVMLGVRRATVSEVLAPFQEAGLVRSDRGVITVLDRAGLEAVSCECYAAVRADYARLMGPPLDGSPPPPAGRLDVIEHSRPALPCDSPSDLSP